MTLQYAGTFARQAVRWHRPLMLFAAVNAAFIVIAGIGMVVDHRLIAGSLAWFKPFKFAVSFALYCTTLAWMISLRRKRSRTLWWAATVFVACGVIEQVLAVMQVLRGTRSHFNATTPFNAAVLSALGATILVLFLATVVIAVLLAFQRLDDAPSLWAIRFGLAISLVGMGLAVLMSNQPSGVEGVVGAHTVGAPDGGHGMPFTGWSTAHGDLRIPHFIGLHALQALPLFATALTWLSTRIPLLRNEGARLALICTAAAGYAGIVVLTTWQALRGQSLVRPDGATITAFGVLLGTVIACAAIIVATTGIRRSEE
ncbi:hypothetical protein AB0M22_27190 [Nocardia sp. NPDC051756]|uniref:hypothetical protein n=1 Tax=Nocardia sp. NPDC051756 TaxID=3154751 RepID=UPI0034184D98